MILDVTYLISPGSHKTLNSEKKEIQRPTIVSLKNFEQSHLQRLALLPVILHIFSIFKALCHVFYNSNLNQQTM